MSDEVTVKVLHRIALGKDCDTELAHARIPFFSDYEPGDTLLHVLTFDCGFPKCGQVERLLTIVWDQLNVDEPKAEWAIEYRNNRNRSLSVGDVVVVGEQAFACAKIGWTPVTLTAEQVW